MKHLSKPCKTCWWLLMFKSAMVTMLSQHLVAQDSEQNSDLVSSELVVSTLYFDMPPWNNYLEALALDDLTELGKKQKTLTHLRLIVSRSEDEPFVVDLCVDKNRTAEINWKIFGTLTNASKGWGKPVRTGSSKIANKEVEQLFDLVSTDFWAAWNLYEVAAMADGGGGVSVIVEYLADGVARKIYMRNPFLLEHYKDGGKTRSPQKYDQLIERVSELLATFANHHFRYK